MNDKGGGWGAWGAGDAGDEQEPDSNDQPPVEQLLIDLGRQVRATNDHLAQLRVYVGLIAFVAIIGVALVALWLFGVITIEFKPTSRF